ncbi:MAG: metallophosphoesterase [Planctomycetota bacterium]|nr:MAG: metallophosphoesterase [Planctomycetota bacterium]
MCKKLQCLLGVVLLLAVSFGIESAEAASFRKLPYLLYPGTNTQMTVLWQLNDTASCTLEWGLDTTYSDGSTGTTEYGTDHQHQYTISSLTPGDKYYYRVTTGGNSATGSFLAAPDANLAEMKLIVYGDTRSQPAIHDEVTGQVVYTYESDPDYQTIALHTGDWVSDDSEDSWTEQWFDPNLAGCAELHGNMPISGCWGNHEGTGTVWEKYYPFPYVDEQYWSFDYGPVHVCIVDQSVSYNTGSAQYTWLENDLATTDREWVFVVLHKPGYSAGGCHTNDNSVQSYIQPLCMDYGVDIVFAGHNHYYARTTVERVKHVTAGTGGAPLCTSGDETEVEVYEEKYHFCKLDIYGGGTQLEVTVVDKDGLVIDTFVISHGPIVDDVAIDETAASGTFTGRYPDTHTSDNDYESIEEILSGGGPATKYSYLENKWVIDVIGGGETVLFKVEAYQSASADNDNFVFAYSTDDVSYTDMLTVTKTSDDDTYQYYEMPNDVNGPVYIQVTDTDQTAGNQGLDTVYVDHMYIRSIGVGGPAPNDVTPPSPDPMTWATVPYETGAYSIAMVATTASDASGVKYYFEETSGNPGGSDSGWQDGTSYEDIGLEPNTTYTYRVRARDRSANMNKTDWSTPESATTMSVGDGGTPFFTDGFESGDFATGGWTTSDNTSVGTAFAYTGTYGAKLGKESWIEKAVSTVGYTDIHLKYARKAVNLGSGEEFMARWYDGSNWHTLESTLDTNWAEKIWLCSISANDNPDFKIRFSSNGGHPSQEYTCLDDVEVSGSGPTPSPSPTPTPTPTATPTPTPTPTPTAEPDMYVNDIAMTWYEPKSNYYAARATIWIKDEYAGDVDGATVTGEWSGATTSGDTSGATGQDGKVTLESKAVKGGGTFTFTVTDVSATGYTYNPSLNVMDSNSISAP